MLATVSALMLLLLAPGPTNTLLFRAGLLFGWRASWQLAFVECLAYLLQVSLWGVALLYLAAYSPWALKATQLAAACYLLYVSYKLWQRKNSAADPSRDRFSGLYFFWLTVMNPKGLLIVSFIAPVGAFATLPGYAGFMLTLVLVVIPVGSAWIVLGSRFEGIQKAWLTPLKINRATSIAIGCFATLMVGRLAESVLH
ncbi:LysE family transporter [Pseudomonas sp. PDM05]|jgi:threonine/homoserine/homoserine lactone efflux protein|uniref:LysE family translocator n=1 Tax=unclassified Pseudomonas TaxID=196821 RepID=UPI00177E26E6|nr:MULTISPECIES: LysE family transporter [unclassified Pseudomonas]MBD9459327.1 LysE family transporter [Pseudomonas sp. PDM05]WLH80571.1 LysE family transporter [Pseudomonas sp. FP2335]